MTRIGLCYCANTKLPTPGPAKYVYSASSNFSIVYSALHMRCDEVWILSAKHGVIRDSDIIAPYNRALKEMSPGEVDAWIAKTREILAKGGPYLAVLPALYARAVEGLDVEFIARGRFIEVNGALGRQAPINPAGWPADWILRLVYVRGPIAMDAIVAGLRLRKVSPKEMANQINRVRACPLFAIRNERIHYRYKDAVMA